MALVATNKKNSVRLRTAIITASEVLSSQVDFTDATELTAKLIEDAARWDQICSRRLPRHRDPYTPIILEGLAAQIYNVCQNLWSFIEFGLLPNQCSAKAILDLWRLKPFASLCKECPNPICKCHVIFQSFNRASTDPFYLASGGTVANPVELDAGEVLTRTVAELKAAGHPGSENFNVRDCVPGQDLTLEHPIEGVRLNPSNTDYNLRNVKGWVFFAALAHKGNPAHWELFSAKDIHAKTFTGYKAVVQFFAKVDQQLLNRLTDKS